MRAGLGLAWTPSGWGFHPLALLVPVVALGSLPLLALWGVEIKCFQHRSINDLLEPLFFSCKIWWAKLTKTKQMVVTIKLFNKFFKFHFLIINHFPMIWEVALQKDNIVNINFSATLATIWSTLLNCISQRVTFICHFERISITVFVFRVSSFPKKIYCSYAVNVLDRNANNFINLFNSKFKWLNGLWKLSISARSGKIRKIR